MIFRKLRYKGFGDGVSYINYGTVLIKYVVELGGLYRKSNSKRDIENQFDKIDIEEVQKICQKIEEIEKKYKKRSKIVKEQIEKFEQFHEKLCEIVAYSKQKAEASA